MNGARQTVLIVEDDSDNMDIYTTVLEFAGYRVIQSTDGVSAVHTAVSELPDLILMDIAMPRMDGLEATRTMRRNPSLASVPIVALTAFALEGDRERVMEAGCSAYLTKPAEPRAVVAEVKRWLDRPRSAPSHTAAQPVEGSA